MSYLLVFFIAYVLHLCDYLPVSCLPVSYLPVFCPVYGLPTMFCPSLYLLYVPLTFSLHACILPASVSSLHSLCHYLRLPSCPVLRGSCPPCVLPKLYRPPCVLTACLSTLSVSCLIYPHAFVFRLNTWVNYCSRSRRRAAKADKRMVLVHTHGLFIT